MRRNGFTLMELLVVITVIVLLAGLLMPLISMARKAATRTKAQSQLSTIQAALSLYMDRNGIYPELQMTSDPAGNNTVLLMALRSVSGDDYRDNKLVDPWGRPILYRPAKTYPFSAGAVYEIDSDQPPNPDTYQLWSSGPDGKDDHGLNDDLVTWKKIKK